jgi:hypothetical protein
MIDLFAAAGLRPEGQVRWGNAVPASAPGVYVVALIGEPESSSPTLSRCPISADAVDVLLERRPELELDGARPTAGQVAERVSSFWIPDEVVLYVGLSGGSLRRRLAQYYATELGARSPHAGGWFLKLLGNQGDLWVHWSRSERPDDAEEQMIAAFASRLSPRSKAALPDPGSPLPFANLRWPRGLRKPHGFVGATAPRAIGPQSGRAVVRSPKQSIGARSSLRRRASSSDIGAFLQRELLQRSMSEVAAVEAAKWLDVADLLRDSESRPGKPLRDLLRQGLILGQRQERSGRWFIDRVGVDE